MTSYRQLQWELCNIEKEMAAMERRAAKLGIPVEMLEALDKGVREVDKRIDRQMSIDGSCPHPPGSLAWRAWYGVRRVEEERIKTAARASFRHDFCERFKVEKAEEKLELKQISNQGATVFLR